MQQRTASTPRRKRPDFTSNQALNVAQSTTVAKRVPEIEKNDPQSATDQMVRHDAVLEILGGGTSTNIEARTTTVTQHQRETALTMTRITAIASLCTTTSMKEVQILQG